MLKLPNRIKLVKLYFKGFFFTLLLVFYYFMYMENALAKYYRGSTTMGERIEEIENQIWPVVILCPEPGFKPSFFKSHGLAELSVETAGIEKYFWMKHQYRAMFENETSMPELFQNMSYILVQDLNIIIYSFS